MNHDVLPPGSAAELQRLRTSNAELRAALSDLLTVVDELIPETVSLMRQARAAIANAIKES